MKRFVGAMAVLVLLAGACGGGDDNDVASDSDETTTSAALSETTVTTAAAGATATTVATGSRRSATTAAGRAGTPGPAAPGTGVPTPAAPGTYEYAQSGTSTAGNVPATGILKVDPANAAGEQVLHYQIDPSQPASDTTVAYRANGPFITQTVQRQQQFVITCKFDPPVPAPPWPPDPGKPITGKSNCGQIQVEVNGSITGKRNVQLDGQTIEVIVATVTIKTTGQVESTTTETRWWSPALRLETHRESKTSGRFGAFPFESNVTTDLKSGKPK